MHQPEDQPYVPGIEYFKDCVAEKKTFPITSVLKKFFYEGNFKEIMVSS